MRRLPGTGSERVGIRTFAYTFVPALIVVGGVAVARATVGTPIEHLTTEPTMLGQVPGYYGLVSTLGVMCWAAAVGMFLMGACLLYDRLGRRDAAFLTASALLTGYLAIDDAFTLHEQLLPSIGIPEEAVYAGILVAVLAYAAVFRHEIARSAWLFLVLAVGFLGTSVVIDKGYELLGSPGGGGLAIWAEDGAKFIGICAWVAYAALSTRGLVRSGIVRAAAGTASPIRTTGSADLPR